MTDVEIQFVVIAGLFGLLVGSFLNVAIYRYPYEERSVRRPNRSLCLACKRQLAWFENIPVFSWVVLRGRCRTCKARVSWRYPLVELLNAGLWSFAAYRTGPEDWPVFLVWSITFSCLLVCTFVDFDHMEIPDEISIPGMFVTPVVSFLLPVLHANSPIAVAFSDGGGVDRTGAFIASVIGVLTGWGVLRTMDWIGQKTVGMDVMGWGDAKLLGFGGGLIGAGGTMVALLIGAMVGSVVGVARIIGWFFYLKKRAGRRGQPRTLGTLLKRARLYGRYLAFGPYLALGIGIALVDWNHVQVLLGALLLGG